MFNAHTITWIYNSELVKNLLLETEYWDRKTKYDRKSNSKTNLEKKWVIIYSSSFHMKWLYSKSFKLGFSSM